MEINTGLNFPSLPAALTATPETRRSPVQAQPWIRESEIARTKDEAPETCVQTTQKRRNNLAARVPSKLLLEASEKTQDPFWKYVLSRASEGKWPRGFKYKNGILAFQIKTKTYEEPITEDMDPDDVCTRLIAFIKTRAGHQSELDRASDSAALRGALGHPSAANESPSQNEASQGADAENADAYPDEVYGRVSAACAWRYKRAHPALFAQYIEDRAREYGMNLRARIELFGCLKFAIKMGWVTEDVVFFDESEESNGIFPKIREIECIKIEPPVVRAVPVVKSAYTTYWSRPPLEESAFPLPPGESMIGPDIMPDSRKSELNTFYQKLRESMKVQNGERYMGSALRPGERAHSARTAMAEAIAATPSFALQKKRAVTSMANAARTAKIAANAILSPIESAGNIKTRAEEDSNINKAETRRTTSRRSSRAKTVRV